MGNTPPRKATIILNEDIVREILTYFQPGCENSKQLRNIALSSKLFSAPALDILWGTLRSWYPLLKLFPGFKVKKIHGVASYVCRLFLDTLRLDIISS
jgi:hypothetical protein